MAQGASQKEVGRSYRAIEKYLQEGGGKGGAEYTPRSVKIADLLMRGIGIMPGIMATDANEQVPVQMVLRSW